MLHKECAEFHNTAWNNNIVCRETYWQSNAINTYYHDPLSGGNTLNEGSMSLWMIVVDLLCAICGEDPQ